MANYLEQFRVVKPYRELLLLGGGFAFLLILNVIHQPNLNDISNIDFFGSTGRLLSVVTFGYFVGRILILISDIYLRILLSLLRGKNIFADFKKGVEAFKKLVDREPEYLSNEDDTISRIEVSLLQEKHPLLGDIMERRLYQQVVGSLFLGATLFLVVDVAIFSPTIPEVRFLVFLLAIITLLKLFEASETMKRNIGLAQHVKNTKNKQKGR